MSILSLTADPPARAESAAVERVQTVSARREFSGRERFALGAFGAALPLLLNVMVTDAAAVFADPNPVAVVFWLLRNAVLAACGGLMAYRLADCRDVLAFLQVGVGTPALVSTWLAGTAPPAPGQQATAAPAHPAATQTARAAAPIDLVALLTFATPAHAAPVQEVLSFRSAAPETFLQSAWRGATGHDRRGTRFVYLPQGLPTPGDAHVRAAGLARQTGLRTHVFAPDGPLQAYVVVFGAWLHADDAEALRATLALGGVEARIWPQ